MGKEIKVRMNQSQILKGFGTNVSNHIRSLLFKDGVTVNTPWGTRVSYLGGGWVELKGSAYTGSDTMATLTMMLS